MTSSTTVADVVIRISAAGSRPEHVDRLAGEQPMVLEVGSMGRPALEPLVSITENGETAMYTSCSETELQEIVAACFDGSESTAGEPDAVVTHAPGTQTFPLPTEFVGTSAVLGGCGWRRPTNPDDHAAAGGFGADDRETVFDLGQDLTGRGWGDGAHDEPVAPVWETASSIDDDPVVVVNGHGTRADTLLLESAPLEVLDGANAVAGAIDATRIVVYAASQDDNALDTARTAAENYPDPVAPIEVVAGKDVYRAGEPTMAIEDIEGNHRLEARRGPPGPATFGLDGRPTVVHTPRTVAQLSVGLREGLPGTRVVTFDGDVSAPATVELPETTTVEEGLDAVELENGWKAASIGGRFGGLTDSLSVQPDSDSLSAAGLGTDGVVRLLGEHRCILEFVGKRTAFGADANCGRCVPCREGTTQLTELLREIYAGTYDQEKIAELTTVMQGTSICEFGVAAARPVRTAMATFETEIEAHADGHCPAGSCLEPMEAHT